MTKILQAIKDREALKRNYFHGFRDEIASSNLSFLRFASLITVILFILLQITATLFIHSWEPSIYHQVFFVIVALFCIGIWLFSKHLALKYTTAVCILFQVLIYAGIISIDVFSNPSAPSSFMQLACIALPILFILPSRINCSMLLIAEGVYLALVLQVKNPFIIQYDVFQLVAGLFFALCVSYLIMNYRLKSHSLRTKYERLSKRDTLSSLYNKRAFSEKTNVYFAKRRHSNVTCSLIIFDLDNFRNINTVGGHAAGDAVLACVGKILKDLFRQGDIVGRFGGDEFVVLLDGLADPKVLKKRFNNVQEYVKKEAHKIIPSIHVSCSAGIIYVSNQDVAYASLFAQADQALYNAKANGKNQCLIKAYDPDFDPRESISANARKAFPTANV